MFTLTDKVLIDRAARLIKEQAQVMLRADCPASGWGATEESRKAKLVYDRLVRDERDLRALGKRLCAHFDVKADRSKPTGGITLVTTAYDKKLGEALGNDAPGNPMTATEALANLPAALKANAPMRDDVSRETSEGNPLLRTDPGAVTVAVLPAPVGNEVHDG